jgi:hypothetical protein
MKNKLKHDTHATMRNLKFFTHDMFYAFWKTLGSMWNTTTASESLSSRLTENIKCLPIIFSFLWTDVVVIIVVVVGGSVVCNVACGISGLEMMSEYIWKKESKFIKFVFQLWIFIRKLYMNLNLSLFFRTLHRHDWN